MDAETKGERAARILEDEVFKEATEGAKQRIKDSWALAEDATTRESKWFELKAIEAVTTELMIIRDDGIMARNRRTKEERRA